jgi:hypothetical protein
MENVAQGVLLMGVFDGHGGADTSDFLQKKLPAELAKQVIMGIFPFSGLLLVICGEHSLSLAFYWSVMVNNIPFLWPGS